MKHFALAGNPNSGKTTLFNALTGSTAHVGNWPGVTVDKRDGVYKKLSEPISIVDLPGIYSLSPYTPEEVVSRNYILDEKPDAIINIVDATNLERNLYLTTQLLEIDVPIVLAINMMDVLEKKGEKIDAVALSKKLGIPVVLISATKNKGLDELMQKAYSISDTKRLGSSVLANGALSHLIRDCKAAFTGLNVEHPLFHAVKLVEMDELEIKNHPDLVSIVDEFKKQFKDETFGSDLEAVVADSRYKYISKNYSSTKSSNNKEKNKLTKSDKVDRVLTNKWAGIPIFLVILFIIFHLTFSANFLFLGNVLNISDDFASNNDFFAGLFYTTDGINSPGVILQNLVIGCTDWITDTVANWMVNSPDWLSGFVVDGVLSGLFSVLSFIPQILLLFAFFSILEDSGYMSRVAFILDRVFRRFGLSGRAFMPMIMGFGCSVPAMINTRTLADQNERTATIRVIPFFSCGAKLPILTAVAGAVVEVFGIGNADLITYGMYLLGISVAIIAVLIMRHTTMRGEIPPFIMELPAYHRPGLHALWLHVWDKAKHFVKKVFTIILASTILIWFLVSFGWDWTMVDEASDSILASIGEFVEPIFTPLGFGSQLGSYGWVFAVAAITGLLAKEQVIATFYTLAATLVSAGAISATGDLSALSGASEASSDGILEVKAMIDATGITWPALIAFIAFNMTTIPCFAAVATAKAELPNNKVKGTLIFWIVLSYIVSVIVFVVLSYWWTVFIVLLLAVLFCLGIHFFNNYRDNKEIARS